MGPNFKAMNLNNPEQIQEFVRVTQLSQLLNKSQKKTIAPFSRPVRAEHFSELTASADKIELNKFDAGREVSINSSDFISRQTEVAERNIIETIGVTSKFLSDPKSEYMADPRILESQIQKLKKEFAGFKDDTGIQLDLVMKHRAADDVHAMFLTASRDGSQAIEIALPTQLGTTSYFSGDTRLGARGVIMDMQDVGAFPVREATKGLTNQSKEVLHYSSLMPVQEAINATLFKSLKTFGAPDKETATRAVLENLRTHVINAFKGIESLAGRADIARFSTGKALPTTTKDVANLLNVHIEGFSDLNETQKVSIVKSALQDSESGIYKIMGGIHPEYFAGTTNGVYNPTKYLPAFTQNSQGKWVLNTSYDKSKISQADFEGVVSKITHQLQSGTDNILMSHKGNLIEDVGLSMSKPLGKSKVKAKLNDAVMFVSPNVLSGNAVGMSPTAQTEIGNIVSSTDLSKVSARQKALRVNVKVKYVGGVVNKQFIEDMASKNKDIFTMNYVDVAKSYAEWASTKGRAMDPNMPLTLGNTMIHHGLPSAYDQARDFMLTNPRADDSDIFFKDIVPRNFDAEKGQHFRFMPGIDNNSIVKDTDVIAQVVDKDGNVIKQIQAGHSGRLKLDARTRSKGNEPLQTLKMFILKNRSLKDQAAIVVDGAKASARKDKSNQLANQIFDDPSDPNYRFIADIESNKNIIESKDSIQRLATSGDHVVIGYGRDVEMTGRAVSDTIATPPKRMGVGRNAQSKLQKSLSKLTYLAHKAGYDDHTVYRELSEQLIKMANSSGRGGVAEDVANETVNYVKEITAKKRQILIDTNRLINKGNNIPTTKENLGLVKAELQVKMNSIDKALDQILHKNGFTQQQIGEFKTNFFGSFKGYIAPSHIERLRYKLNNFSQQAIEEAEKQSQWKHIHNFQIAIDDYLESGAEYAAEKQRITQKKVKPLKLSWRSAAVDMSRELLTDSGALHRKWSEGFRLIGNKSAGILRGAMLMNYSMASLPVNMYKQMADLGLIRSVDMSGSNFSTGLMHFRRANQIRKGIAGTGAMEHAFGQAMDMFVVDGANITHTSFNFKLSDNIRKSLETMISNGMFNEQQIRVANQIISSGIYTPSNELLGRGVLTDKRSGEFLEQRSNLLGSMSDLADAATSGNTKQMEDTLKRLVDTYTQNARTIGKTMQTDSFWKSVASGEVQGGYLRSMQVTKGAARSSSKIAASSATVYLSMSRYSELFQMPMSELTGKESTYATIGSFPDLATTNTAVVRVKIDKKLEHSQIGVHGLMLESMKKDFDNDSLFLAQINDREFGVRGFRDTVKNLRFAHEFYEEVLPELKKMTVPIKEMKGDEWLKALEESSQHGKKTGRITNSLGLAHNIVVDELISQGAFEATDKVSKQRAVGLAAVGSLINFMGEGQIRSFKLTSDTVASAKTIAEILQGMMNPEKYGQMNKGEAIHKITSSVMSMIGFQADKHGLQQSKKIAQYVSDGEYILWPGDKKSVVSPEALALSRETAIPGLRIVDKNKVKESVTQLVNALEDSKKFVDTKNAFELLSKKSWDSPEQALMQLEEVIKYQGPNKSHLGNMVRNILDPSSNRVINTDNVEKILVETQQEIDVKQKVIAEEIASVEQNKLKDTIKSVHYEGATFQKFGNYAHGAIGGALMVSAFAIASKMFGANSSEMDAPLPPNTPMKMDDSMSTFSSIDTPSPYLRNQSALSSRMRVRGRGDPSSFTQHASEMGYGGYVSYQDRSLNDAQYVSGLNQRISGRY